jgi:hypothetical protein
MECASCGALICIKGSPLRPSAIERPATGFGLSALKLPAMQQADLSRVKKQAAMMRRRK